MASLNSVTLIGRVVAPPELRYTPTGKAVANFDIAVDRRKSGNQDKETDFIPVVVWEKLAEICNEYLTKGKLVCIVGALRTRTYEKDGQKRKAFEILCNEMQMLGSPGERNSSERPAERAPSRPSSGGGPANWSSDGFGGDVGLEDIPF
jgi:single-strand DNA-binding protein